MGTWADFAAEAPSIADAGRRLIYRAATGAGLLATVRGDSLPRIHPITVAVADGRLVAFIILESPKARDLAEDGRYALHAHHDPNVPHEFTVRGRAQAIDGPEARASFAESWKFEVDDSYRLFEFQIDHAILGQRATPNDWPPQYTSWRDPRA